MKNSISDLIKEIFAEVNKEIVKILNFKNNEKKLKINEEKTLINNNSNNEKKDNNYIKEDDIINVTNFKEERIDYTEFKNEKTEIINNWKFELDKTIWNYYSELKIPILKGEIIELYNKICETADIELRKKKKSLIKEIIKVKKGNYYFREKIFNDIFSGTIQVINGEYRGNKRNINENYYFRDFFDIIGENINKIIINEINAYLKELPRLNTEIIEYYNLTPNGLPYRYWDKNGKFREEHKFSELEQRILEKTSFRQTKIWNNYEAKKQMILLYLDEWKIIEERVKTEEKLKKKSKKIINAILNLQDYVYFEYNEIEGLYAILKIIENKIRSFIPNYKILETEKELESIKKFFPKSMSNELLENIENLKISKEKIESILDYEIKNYPKDWKLKLGYIELFNEKKINLIIWLINFGIVINSNAATNSKKGCYIPKGELTCVTDITTETGKKKLNEMKKQKSELFEKSQESLKNGRFGNKTVGFIDFPRGWKMFVDADSGKTTMQITRDGFDIYTLDIIYLNNKNNNLIDLVDEVAKNQYNGLLNAGHSRDNLEMRSIIINGYKGKQVKVKRISGKSWISNYIGYNGKIYLISVEGSPQNVNEMQKNVERSWNPLK